MTRDGLVEVNETEQTAERVSSREQDADFLKSPEQQAAQDAAQLQGVPSAASPLPSAPELPHQQDTGAAERVMEHIDAAHTRKASKKAAQRAQREAAAKEKSSRLQFTDEELATPELEKYVKKSNEAADRLDAARAAIPKEKKLIDKVMFEEKETNLQLVAGPMFKLPDQTKMNAARKMMESGEEVPDKVALQKLKLLKLKGEKR